MLYVESPLVYLYCPKFQGPLPWNLDANRGHVNPVPQPSLYNVLQD